MDERIAIIQSEFANSASIDFLTTRHRIVDLFGEVTEEQDRVVLLAMLDSVIGLAIRSQEAKGVDTGPLRNALLADKRSLVLQEAMGPNKLAEPTEMLRILDREIVAGRMERDSFHQLAADGAKVLGAPSKQREKIGLFKRIFG